MLTLILKYLFAGIFISLGLLTLHAATRAIRRKDIPESVYERVVNWRMEIQQMDDFVEKCRQLEEWRAFVKEIPDKKNKGLKLLK